MLQHLRSCNSVIFTHLFCLVPGASWSVELSPSCFHCYHCTFHGHPTLLLSMAKAAFDCTNEQSRKIPLLVGRGYPKVSQGVIIFQVHDHVIWSRSGSRNAASNNPKCIFFCILVEAKIIQTYLMYTVYMHFTGYLFLNNLRSGPRQAS